MCTRVMDAGAGVLSILQVLPKRPREEVAGQTPTPSVVNTTSGSVRDLWTPLNYSTLLPLFTFLKNNNIINSLFKSSYNSSVIIAVTPGVPVR